MGQVVARRSRGFRCVARWHGVAQRSVPCHSWRLRAHRHQEATAQHTHRL